MSELSSVPWERSIPKKYTNSFALPQLEKVVANQLSPIRDVPNIVSYSGVSVGPMTVRLEGKVFHQDIKHASQVLVLEGSVDAEEKVCFGCQTEEDIRCIISGVLVALHGLHNKHRVLHGCISRDMVVVVRRQNRAGSAAAAGAEGASAQNNAPPLSPFLAEYGLPLSLYAKGTAQWKRATRMAAPEVLRAQPYGYAADVWGVGALFVDIVHMMSVARQTNRKGAVEMLDTEAILEGGGLLMPELSALSPSAMSFVLPCLKENPDVRPSIADLLMHPFMNPQSGQLHAGMRERRVDPNRGVSTGNTSSDTESEEEEEEEEADEEDEEDSGEDEDDEEEDSD